MNSFGEIEYDDLLEVNHNLNISYSSSFLSVTPSLENLISFHNSINPDEKEEDKNKINIKKFKEANINKFKEDALYYCSSPETLLNYKRNMDEETNYEFYKSADCEQFLACQKGRSKNLLSVSKNDLFIKKNMLSNYNDFCANASFVTNNNNNKIKMINANLIRKKMEEYGLFFFKDIDENKMLSYLDELKAIFEKNPVDMESLGLIHFNYIENNLFLLLKLILNKIKQKMILKY